MVVPSISPFGNNVLNLPKKQSLQFKSHKFSSASENAFFWTSLKFYCLVDS